MSEEKKQEGLAEVLAGVFKEEIKAELKKEQKDPIYKAQAEFHNCRARAEGLSEKARNRCNKIYGLAILNHREKDHNENHKAEREDLESKMSTEDIELASRGFWRS